MKFQRCCQCGFSRVRVRPSLILLAMLAVSFAGAAAQAQGWVANANTYYASPNLFVVVSDRGLLVVETKEAMPLQAFNPRTLTVDQSFSAFINYDPEQSRFTELIVKGQSYPIRAGSGVDFTFGEQGVLQVRLDGYNRYVTFMVRYENGQGLSRTHFLGVLGTSVVVNTANDRLADLLVANSSLVNLRKEGLLQSYRLSSAGVRVADREVAPGTLLGVEMQRQQHDCLKPDSLVIGVEDYKKLRALRREPIKAKNFLKSMIDSNRSARFFSRLLILSVDKNLVVGLDVVKASIQIVRTLSTNSKGPGAKDAGTKDTGEQRAVSRGVTVCLAEDIEVS